MNERIIAFLVHFVTHVIDLGGYTGIAVLMGIESACIPLPSEIIMPFAGYLAYMGRFSLILAATAGAVGCNVGSALAYWIGAKGGRPLVERYGKWVLMNHRDLDRMTIFFNKYGSITVLLARLLPWCAPLSHSRRELPRCRSSVSTSILFWVPGRGALHWPTRECNWGRDGIRIRVFTRHFTAFISSSNSRWLRGLSGLSGRM